MPCNQSKDYRLVEYANQRAVLCFCYIRLHNTFLPEMSEDQKKQLEQQLWNIANTLRGKMNADEFRDYILGFIFYKYLSEKMSSYANQILIEDGITYDQLDERESSEQRYHNSNRLSEDDVASYGKAEISTSERKNFLKQLKKKR